MESSPLQNNTHKLFCVDPGTTHSGVVVIDKNQIALSNSSMLNEEVLRFILTESSLDHMPIEMIASYGMAVGKTTFETVLWIGRFIQAFGAEKSTKVYRKEVTLHLCHSVRAKDTNVRQAILDLFPATGGGKTPQIGTKNNPGPLYGVTSHALSAFAVGLTYIAIKTPQ